jgi:hypothetical protein
LQVWIIDLEEPIINDVAPECSKYLTQAIKDQQKIGWDQWFCGTISRKWDKVYSFDIIKPNILTRLNNK